MNQSCSPTSCLTTIEHSSCRVGAESRFEAEGMRFEAGIRPRFFFGGIAFLWRVGGSVLHAVSLSAIASDDGVATAYWEVALLVPRAYVPVQ